MTSIVLYEGWQEEVSKCVLNILTRVVIIRGRYRGYKKSICMHLQWPPPWIDIAVWRSLLVLNVSAGSCLQMRGHDAARFYSVSSHLFWRKNGPVSHDITKLIVSCGIHDRSMLYDCQIQASKAAPQIGCWQAQLKLVTTSLTAQWILGDNQHRWSKLQLQSVS